MKQIIKYLLLIFLILDISYSFVQHYNMPLDGDMADIIMPSNDFQHVLDDPLGFNVILYGESYPNPNRFFAHWAASIYFKNIPLLLQSYIKPLDSVYLSCAIAKTMIQLAIIYLLVLYVTGCRNIFKLKFLIPAVLITPMFQTSGYNRFMGVIDQSVIYTFFYALPLALILIYFLPFYKAFNNNQKPKFGIAKYIFLFFMSFILAFNGPLTPAIIVILCGLILLSVWWDNYQIANSGSLLRSMILPFKKAHSILICLLIFSGLLSLYSIIIGSYNSLNDMSSISLVEYYSRLPLGLYNLITQKLAWPLLIILISVNMIIIRKKYNNIEGQRILQLFKWIGIFAAIYIILLPLGGFRAYRSNAIRYDTILPVTIGFIFIYALSSYYLINNLKLKPKRIYITVIIGFLLLFTISDISDCNDNECERRSFNILSESPGSVVKLPGDCNLMSWRKIHNSEESDLKAEMIYYWHITEEKKLFYQD